MQPLTEQQAAAVRALEALRRQIKRDLAAIDLQIAEAREDVVNLQARIRFQHEAA